MGQERLQQEGRSVNGTGAGAFPWQSCMQSCCCKLGTSQHNKVAVEGSFGSCLNLFRPWVDLAHSSVSREGLEPPGCPCQELFVLGASRGGAEAAFGHQGPGVNSPERPPRCFGEVLVRVWMFSITLLSIRVRLVWFSNAVLLISGTSRGFVVPLLDVMTTLLHSRNEGPSPRAKNARTQPKSPCLNNA